MRQRASLCSLLAAAAALQPAARKPTGGRLPTRALQPAARKPAGGRRPTRRHMSADGDAAPAQQTDPVLEVERLENAIAESTEPNEQKELAEKLGMSRMSAEMSVLSANAAFYDAFQSCDVAKMKAVWSDSDDVTCVHPGHPLISGADLVLNSWRALFSSAGGMPKLEAQRQRVVLRCVEINQCVGCTRQFFTKSFLGDDASVLARSSGEEPASPRHRAGVASMAWNEP
jgi:hypothetical protein